MVLPVSGLHCGILEACRYARSIASDVRAVYVEIDPEKSADVQDEWYRFEKRIPLTVLRSPYRSLLGPLLEFIESVRRAQKNQIVTVVIPEFVTYRWWHGILHNQTALFLRAALLFKQGVVVTSVRYRPDISKTRVTTPQ